MEATIIFRDYDPKTGRYRVRQEKSLPLLKTFKTWLEANAGKVMKGSLTRTAMDYTLRTR